MAVTNIVKKIFGSRNDRVLKLLGKDVVLINQFEKDYQQLSVTQLKEKTAEFKQRLQAGAALNSLLPEAFAIVREAAVRALNMRHFDVQMIGGMVLHQGNIAEMLTGEGKTLASTLPAYLNALTGKNVHIVTVNDYLAKRDAEWMKPVYDILGLTVGINLAGMTITEKQQAYSADITYGTNNEFGFDFLRDNMAFSPSDRVQRGLYFAIVDEVDSILIDEARTPLIISGPSEEGPALYTKVDSIIPKLSKQEVENGPGDYMLEEKSKQAYLTEEGHQHVEELLIDEGLLQQHESLYDAGNIILMYHVNAALRAHMLFHKDVDYVVKNAEIVIVDEHTGRLMTGRRWADGLHQAVEAKEKVPVQHENQTLASITFQNYFRTYEKLAGMTGTADTEAYEFHQIYGLEVIVIPPNKSVIRQDYADKVYLSVEEKFTAVVEELKDCVQRGQPVLVGTASIEASEYLAAFLKKVNIKHEILNAKQHEREAHIIAQAGRPGAITIATNMAGRGTDIVLGGNLVAEIAQLTDPSEQQIAACKQQWQARHQQVVAAGGLHVLGTERHESRRIDNQLRGRAGRQGDPGTSRFYLSLKDNLLRIFASEKLSGIMQRIGASGEAMEHPMLSRVIENAQRKVEGHNFDIRKQLLEYDDVANEQRKKIYEQRSQIMDSDDVREIILAMMEDVVDSEVSQCIPPETFAEEWDIASLVTILQDKYLIEAPIKSWMATNDNLQDDDIKKNIYDLFKQHYFAKAALISEEMLRQLEKSILLQFLDHGWKEHLAAMDMLRQGIHLRGYAQKNPKQEYKREAFEMFAAMLEHLRQDVISSLLKLHIEDEQQADEIEAKRRQSANLPITLLHGQQVPDSANEDIESTSSEIQQPFTRQGPKVGRNAECPCGSGKKYKHCHGKVV